MLSLIFRISYLSYYANFSFQTGSMKENVKKKFQLIWRQEEIFCHSAPIQLCRNDKPSAKAVKESRRNKRIKFQLTYRKKDGYLVR
jgi:hypothetical protein